MAYPPLRIGILNLMHDRAATRARFEYVLQQANVAVQTEFFYPVSHYRQRAVPVSVQALAAPLSEIELAKLDGFIITGAPIEHLAFCQVDYWAELQTLIDQLVAHSLPQLYVCWGAMAALHHLYGIDKVALPQKYFGVYANQIYQSHPVLTGLPPTFWAPHARYAEMNRRQILAHPALQLNAESVDHRLMLVSNPRAQQLFLYAHLEYEREALLAEYQREITAHPEREYRQPQNYFADPLTMQAPQFKWETTQRHFFNNWVTQIAQHKAAAHKEDLP